MKGQPSTHDSWELAARWPGGTVSALTRAGAADGSQEAALAATAAGLHTSTDGGRSWTWIGLGPAPIPETLVVSRAFHDDGTALLGTAEGLFRSTDGGASWRPVVTGSRMQCLDAAQDIIAGGIVLAGTESDGILRSEDGGLNWSGANAGLLDLNVTAVALSPHISADRTAFAGTTSGVYRSRNGGRAWRLVELGPEAPVVQAIAVSPSFLDDGVVLVGTESDGLFVSYDLGQTWEPVETFPEPCITSLCFGRSYGFVVAGTAEGVAVSHDLGKTWELEAPELGPILSLTVLNDAVLAGTLDRGMVRRELGAAPGSGDWLDADQSLAGLATASLAVLPRADAPPTIAVATLDSAVLLSTDGGASWSTSSAGLSQPGATSVVLVASPGDGAASVLATFTDGLYRSVDGGTSWQPVDLPVGADARPAWLNAAGSSVVVAGRSCLALSDDAGASWRSIPLPPGSGDLASAAISPDIARDQTVYAVARVNRIARDGSLEPAGLELWHSDNLGQTWMRWLESPTATVMVVAVPRPGDLDTSVLVGHAGRFSRTLSGAEQVRGRERRPIWRETQIGSLGSPVTALALSPRAGRDRTVLAASENTVYVSRDGGATFSAWDDGLDVPLLTGLALVPDGEDNFVAYALGLGGTLWRRPL